MRWVHEPTPGIDVGWFDSPKDILTSEISNLNKGHRRREWLDPDKNAHQGRYFNLDWYGTAAGMPAVLDAMTGKQAWPEGETHWAEAESAMRAMPLAKVKSVRRRRRRGEEGAELDADRMYAGDFDSMWIRTQREASRTPRHLRILINVGGTGEKPASEMLWAGVAGALLVELLRKSGRNSEVHVFTVASYAYECGTDCALVVKVKDATQRLDVRALLAWAAMPGSFRSALFHGRATNPTKQLTSGLGSNTTTKDTTALLKRIDPGASAAASVVVPKLDSLADAQRWLADIWSSFARGER